MAKKTWPGVDPGSPEHGARRLSEKLRERLRFSSEQLGGPEYAYVAWLDLMGAGNSMETSVHKTANAIARIHLATHYAKADHSINCRTLAINDGVFIATKSKIEIMNIVRSALLYLIGNFVARPSQQDRFLARCAIAYGPIYSGEELAKQLERKHLKAGAEEAFLQVIFGPPIIHAYRAESSAPPYGVAVHESARAFAPDGEGPFRSRLWLWWQANDDGGIPAATPQPISPVKDVFVSELMAYFDYMEATAAFHGIGREKIQSLRELSKQYYIGYAQRSEQEQK